MTDFVYTCSCDGETFYLGKEGTVICSKCMKQQLGLVVSYPDDITFTDKEPETNVVDFQTKAREAKSSGVGVVQLRTVEPSGPPDDRPRTA